jgi:membrane associated rhomboid family serine protease
MAQPLEPVTTLTLVAMAIVTWKGLSDRSFQNRFMDSSQAIWKRREYYRMFTSGFLHGNWMHFALNATVLYGAGMMIERRFGSLQFALIFGLSILGGSLVSNLIHRKEEYCGVGASGGGSGIILAAVFLFPGAELSFPPMPMWMFALLFIGISVYGAHKSLGNIGHAAHLGGALTGLLLAPLLVFTQVKDEASMYIGFMIIIVGGLLYLERDSFAWLQRKKCVRKKRKTPAPPSQASDRVNSLLDKISREGIHSLSAEEKAFLKRSANRGDS